MRMENHWAAEQLQVIRTLMERSAVYRRALAPIMTCTGAVGIVAGLLGWLLQINTIRGFVGFWICVGTAAALTAFLLVRRQAIRESEPLWSLPTRRVGQALFPAYCVGLAVSLLVFAFPTNDLLGLVGLPPFLMVLYGCALHAAGFFMTRGIRLFAWLYLIGGIALIGWSGLANAAISPVTGHIFMGTGFGGLHLAYGIYLYFTEKGGNAA